jgi:hypothetical protein
MPRPTSNIKLAKFKTLPRIPRVSTVSRERVARAGLASYPAVPNFFRNVASYPSGVGSGSNLAMQAYPLLGDGSLTVAL